MKSTLLKLVLLLSLITNLSFAKPDPSEEEMKLLGTWEYLAPAAGFGYQKANLVFSYENNGLVGRVILGENSMPLRNLILEENKVRAYIMYQGSQVFLFLKFHEASFEGTVSNRIAYMRVEGYKKEID